MKPSSSQSDYRSVFLSDDWVHQQYFGWKVEQDDAGLRILSKSRFGLCRYLLLLTEGGDSALQRALKRLSGLKVCTSIVIHDFDDALSAETRVSIQGREFVPARKDQRLLNIATFVVDLSCELGDLWGHLGSKSRNAVRKCEKESVIFGSTVSPQGAIDTFFQQSAVSIAQHGLKYAAKATLLKMANDGRLHILEARLNGDIKNVTMIYECGGTGFYMYGSNAKELPTGLGQFVQWETIKYLKHLGLRWYDLGGVPSKVPSDPIYRFKESIGGACIDLGKEYLCESPALSALRAMKGLLKRMGARPNALLSHTSPPDSSK